MLAYRCGRRSERPSDVCDERKFSEHVRSKTLTAQIHGALLTVVCYNLVCLVHEMNDSGINPAR